VIVDGSVTCLIFKPHAADGAESAFYRERSIYITYPTLMRQRPHQRWIPSSGRPDRIAWWELWWTSLQDPKQALPRKGLDSC